MSCVRSKLILFIFKVNLPNLSWFVYLHQINTNYLILENMFILSSITTYLSRYWWIPTSPILGSKQAFSCPNPRPALNIQLWYKFCTDCRVTTNCAWLTVYTVYTVYTFYNSQCVMCTQCTSHSVQFTVYTAYAVLTVAVYSIQNGTCISYITFSWNSKCYRLLLDWGNIDFSKN